MISGMNPQMMASIANRMRQRNPGVMARPNMGMDPQQMNLLRQILAQRMIGAAPPGAGMAANPQMFAQAPGMAPPAMVPGQQQGLPQGMMPQGMDPQMALQLLKRRFALGQMAR